MKITKFNHCCLLVEENGVRILTDPGTYSKGFENLKNLDVILITHEHPDHYHVPALKEALNNNPDAKIITNKGVGRLLDSENIKHELLEDGQRKDFKGILIEAIGHEHAPLYKTSPCVNTGFFIANKLWYPGDSLHNPNKPVELLALPVAGPWMKLEEAIEYALELKPTIAFPVHEAGLASPAVVHRIPPTILEPAGIKFLVLENDKEYEF